MYRISEALLRMLNPVLPFTMDEFNRNLPGKRELNVQLLNFPKAKELSPTSKKLDEEYELFISLRNDVLKALEVARNNQIIGSSQQALVEIAIVNEKEKVEALLANFTKEQLPCLFVVSEIKVLDDVEAETYNLVKAKVSKHQGHFCERCWNYEDDAVLQEDGTYLCKRCQKVVGK